MMQILHKVIKSSRKRNEVFKYLMAAVMNSVVIYIPKDLKNGDFAISRRGRGDCIQFSFTAGK